MRIVFTGANEEVTLAARMLIKQGHDIIIIDTDREKLKQISDELDCGVLHGDGGKPAILKEANPEHADILFCLSDHDQDNVLAALVGRSLGFKRVIPCIVDAELEPICRELGLANTIIPTRAVSRHLVDMASGLDTIELSTVLREDARFFTFTAGEEDAVRIGELDIPEGARPICYYRDEVFHFADEETLLRQNDEVILIALSETLPKLRQRWNPKRPRSP